MPKKRGRYGDYTAIIDGDLYAVVNIPLGNGKYKKKRKKVSSKTEARQWALAMLDNPQAENVSNKTFTWLAEWYEREFLIPPVYQTGKRLIGVRTWKAQRYTLAHLVKQFGLHQLTTISVDTLRRYKRERLKHVSIATVNREFALMRTMFKKALSRKWVKESPFDFGENLIEIALELPRQSPLTDRIAKRLLARSRKSEQPLLHYLILVAMHTGARPSEIHPFNASDDSVIREPLTWAHVLEFDFKAVRLVSYKGRIRKERVVPASRELETGLRALHLRTNPSPEDIIFPITTFRRSWATLCRSIGVKGIWLRDFRHYYNSKILLMPQFNDMERMLLLGQVHLSTNVRYSHLDEAFVKKYREVISGPIIETDSIN